MIKQALILHKNHILFYVNMCFNDTFCFSVGNFLIWRLYWQARTRIISNSSTPIEIYNKYIYNVDVETDRLLPASAKCARFHHR